MARKDREAVNRGLEEVLGGTDILGNVISRDRERYRRSEPDAQTAPAAPETPEYDNNTSHTVIQQYDTPAIPQADTQEDKQTDSEAIRQTTIQTDQPKRRRHTRAAGGTPDATLALRVSRATEISKGPTTTITLRVPAQMNEWLDEYVHKAWPTKVKKQDLVTEALRMLIARRGSAGEEPIPTRLLPEEAEPED